MTPNQETQITVLDMVVQPSKTYRMKWEDKTIEGSVDDFDAVYQAVQKLLNTERASYPIYSSNYGIELERLIGKDLSFVRSDIGRILNEALTADERILGVENVKVLSAEGDSLAIEFEVITIFGRLSVTN